MVEELIEKELSLEDYIRIMNKRKKFIISFTLACTMLISIISLFMANIYQTKATLLIMPPKFKTEDMVVDKDLRDLREKSNLISGLMPKSLSVKTYEALLKDPNIIKNIINRLSLEEMKVEDLNKDLKVNLVIEAKSGTGASYTPLVELIVKADGPKTAQDIANLWADLAIEKNREIYSQETSILYKFIISQYTLIKENLEKAESALKDFNEKNNLDFLEKELINKKELLYGPLSKKNIAIYNEKPPIGYKAKLNETRLLLRTNEEVLASLGQELKELSQSDSLYQDVKKKHIEIKVLVNSLKQEEAYISELVKKTEQDILALEKEVQEKELEQNKIKRDIATHKKTYELFAEKKESAEIANKEEIPDLKIVSRAIQPEKKIGPHRRTMALLGGVIGLFGGIFLAFLMEYARPKR